MLERLFRAADRRKWTLALAIATPVWIALMRMLLERYLSLGDVPLRRPAFPWFAHIVTFYLTMSVTLSAVLVVLGRLQWKQAMNQVGMGLALGCLPPIIDTLVLGRGKFAYEYAPSSFPWLLSGPNSVLPPGETTTLWLTIALMTFAVWRASKSVLRTFATTVTTYALVLIFLVGIPAGSQWLSARTAMAPSDWRNALFGVAAMFGVVTLLGQWKRVVTRVPQVLLPMLFVALGAAQRGVFDGPATLAAVMVALLGIGFTLANDWYDRREDEAENVGADGGVSSRVTCAVTTEVLPARSLKRTYTVCTPSPLLSVKGICPEPGMGIGPTVPAAVKLGFSDTVTASVADRSLADDATFTVTEVLGEIAGVTLADTGEGAVTS